MSKIPDYIITAINRINEFLPIKKVLIRANQHLFFILEF